MEFSIKSFQDFLRKATTDWEPDSSAPPEYYRKDGMNNILATVSVRCGSFQNPHKPHVIGWRAQMGNIFDVGMVSVDQYASLEQAIKAAQGAADEALRKLGRNF